MSIFVTSDPMKSQFSSRVAAEGGESLNRCFQCGKCSAGCPISYEMDLTPIRVIQAVRLGQKDKVLNSRTIWLCASCETCSTRCPREVDIAKLMDALRIIARKERVPAAIPQVPIFSSTMLGLIKVLGRTYELGIVAIMKLRTMELTKDVKLGIKMLSKGKLKLFPSFVRNSNVRKIFARVAKKEQAEKV